MRTLTPKHSRVTRRGFTLIELLIVIAIILILITIALPNFLEAQIRAKVSKVGSDLRSIGIALQMYYNDFGYYPEESESVWADQNFTQERGLAKLTTPIPYIRSIPEDPFPNRDASLSQPNSIYVYYGGGCRTNEAPAAVARVGPIYAVWSLGPGGGLGIRATVPNVNPYNGEIVSYSATNGTKSHGTIHYFTGEGAWWGLNTEESSASNVCSKDKLKKPELRVGIIVDKHFYLGQVPPGTFQR